MTKIYVWFVLFGFAVGCYFIHRNWISNFNLIRICEVFKEIMLISKYFKEHAPDWDQINFQSVFISLLELKIFCQSHSVVHCPNCFIHKFDTSHIRIKSYVLLRSKKTEMIYLKARTTSCYTHLRVSDDIK